MWNIQIETRRGHRRRTGTHLGGDPLMCNSPAVQSQPLIFITISFFIYFPKNSTMAMFTGPPPVKIKLEGIHSLLERRPSHVQFTCSAITALNIY
jgi:hypothetical protein